MNASSEVRAARHRRPERHARSHRRGGTPPRAAAARFRPSCRARGGSSRRRRTRHRRAGAAAGRELRRAHQRDVRILRGDERQVAVVEHRVHDHRAGAAAVRAGTARGRHAAGGALPRTAATLLRASPTRRSSSLHGCGCAKSGRFIANRLTMAPPALCSSTLDVSRSVARLVCDHTRNAASAGGGPDTGGSLARTRSSSATMRLISVRAFCSFLLKVLAAGSSPPARSATRSTGDAPARTRRRATDTAPATATRRRGTTAAIAAPASRWRSSAP